MRELFKKEKDTVENVKEQRQEIQTVLDGRILPNKNHKCFEYNLKSKILSLAELEAESFEIDYSDALLKFQNKTEIFGEISKIPTKTKSKIIRKENCIYMTALNVKNAEKILKRNFEIILKQKQKNN